MQVFMSKNETLDMLEKISSRGSSAKAQLDSKNSILENLYSKLLYSHFFLKKMLLTIFVFQPFHTGSVQSGLVM